MNTETLDRARFIDILRRLIALTPRLQNSPGVGLIPEERLAAEVVLEELRPHIERGFIRAERLAAPGHEARPNLMLTVTGAEAGTIGLVGAHFDVVPADREGEGWTHDPFELRVEDDGTLYARGVTDCLGHVALLTEYLRWLAESGRRPRRTVSVVLISNEEEAPLPEIGLDYVVGAGHLDALRGGPIYWLDSADFGPTVGTGGMCMWELAVEGVPGHSGLTHNCVNALELAMATTLALGEWFRGAFPTHPDEARYGFLSSSTLKATVINAANQKTSKIPGAVTVSGDIRLVPFYDMNAAVAGAIDFVKKLDERIQRGDPPAGFPRTRTVNGESGHLALTQKGRFMEGIACDLESPGLAALERAMRSARGADAVAPYSMTGSLPLVRDLQRSGFDVQITGFGRSIYYHAPNEQAKLRDFEDGFVILRELIELV
ncbi:MAG: M20/M25/M40 family metallo-hydrolase [Sorangiineae bacterium]|nr:M20/M25/M40 family metallo-hydrolase [Polyangiaceae bacterium]MEB2323269.1 M20/M25/M40 family metallo-hydrolase [Sorangiineae bacterium]